MTRLSDFEQSLGIARNVLTDRLNRLVEEGNLRAPALQEHPARYGYCLPLKSSDPFTVLNAPRRWGHQYLNAEPVRLLRRKHDKTPVIAALVPDAASVLATPEIEFVPGPPFPRRGGGE